MAYSCLQNGKESHLKRNKGQMVNTKANNKESCIKMINYDKHLILLYFESLEITVFFVCHFRQ